MIVAVHWNSQNTQAKLGSLTSLPGWVRGTGRKVGVDVFEAACRRQVVVGDWDAFRGRVVDGGGAGEKADFAVFEDGEGDVGCRMSDVSASLNTGSGSWTAAVCLQMARPWY